MIIINTINVPLRLELELELELRLDNIDFNLQLIYIKILNEVGL